MNSQLTTKALRISVPINGRKKLGGDRQKQFDNLRKTVTLLLRNERIEGPVRMLDESRQYVERLIELAKKYGDRHVATMQVMDYWILEKDLIHKMFKVLVPRFSHFSGPYTIQHRLSKEKPCKSKVDVMLELKGNPYPRIIPDLTNYRYTLTNVLIRNAIREVKNENKYKQIDISVD
ncbi:hypothetical protein GJ496_002993 [Pomphorhynchus laevis]|nr:hypothetical protein GJ496_002993 [Pomphorhynchus laevis]